MSVSQKENLCQSPEYPAEMFAEYFESAKARALRTSAIETIIGDDYDLDRLRELVAADRDGRCVVLPISTPSMAYTVDQKGGYISSGFYVTPGAVLHDTERGYIIAKTREAAEAALKGEQHEKH
jgi:hypothetical protein